MAVCARCGVDLPDDARFCPSCGAPVEAGVPPPEERKLATVLFADLVGSTALAGDQDPERTRQTLDRFYDSMAEEIETAGGTVEKFAGDAVMAAFGAPAAHEDHAERALHSALSMRRRLAELFGATLQLRIGVNTGEVVVGRPREGSSFVTGDPVNVAARLEQSAGPDEVLVGERTVAAARGAFEFGEPSTIEAKGKPGGVVARRLVRALTLMRPRGVSGLGDAFVGRATELELLAATYARAVERREPHIVTIMGDAGVGKTRLARELWRWLAEQSPQPFQRTGRCLAYGNVTYWALGEVLKEHLGILESDSPEIALRRLGGREILGLALGLDVAGDLHPLAARDHLHDAWLEFLEDLASGRPTVLLIEDVHWAEEPLLDLLERLAREARGSLLLLATARPELLERRPAWGGGRRNASLLWIDALTADDSRQMLQELLAAELPEALRDVVVDRAEGNPFFVEELLGALIDRGVLVRDDEGWTVRELPAGFSIPDSVQAILAARIDLLGPTEKAGLQAASVIGRAFWKGPVCELLGDEPDLALLEDRDFIRRQVSSTMAGEEEYAFKHALTREVAYASLTKARRARLHASFGRWLEQAGRDDLAPLLAHHFAEAVRPEDADLAWEGEPDELEWLRDRALSWLERAADLAIGRYDITEALALLQRGVDLDPAPAVAARLWRSIARANVLWFDGEAFWTAMQRSLELETDDGLRAEALSILAFQTSIRSGMWRDLPAREVVDGWIDRALELSAPESAARARALAARSFWRREGRGEAAREASALAERVGDVELRSYAWAARSVAAYDARQFDEASMWSSRRFELLPEITDPDHVTEVFETAVPSAVALMRMREARRIASDHIDTSRRLSPHHRIHGLGLALEIEDAAGAWEAVLELTETVELAAEENRATPCVRNARNLLVCAVASAATGDEERARTLEELAGGHEMQSHVASLAPPRLRLALLRRDLEEVERRLVETNVMQTRFAFGPAPLAVRLDGLAAIRDRDAVESEAAALLRVGTYLEPFALRALGIVREDDGLIERAHERFQALKLDWHAEQTESLVR